MILLIDNYDSFSYNLYQMIGEINPNIKVIRNNEITVGEIEALKPQKIIISPGPGRPEEAGICIETIKKCGEQIPILGVCLGHQAVCMAYGGKVGYAKRLMHGKMSKVKVNNGTLLFKGLPEYIEAARYHSLAAEAESLPSELIVTAETEDGEIMAVQHRVYSVYGVQFHPESLLTPKGKIILENFLKM